MVILARVKANFMKLFLIYGDSTVIFSLTLLKEWEIYDTIVTNIRRKRKR